MTITLDAPTETLPRPAEGTQFLGEYRDSGYSRPPYLIRRGDGHNIQVSHLVYLVADALNRHDRPTAVATEVSQAFQRDVSPENVLYLIENKLAPVGIVADPDRSTPPATANPLLALKLRIPLVPERAHSMVTGALSVLFWPPIIIGALLGLLIADTWLVASQGQAIANGVRMIFFEPKLLLIITLCTLFAGVFHEIGHAAAARRGGARPGAMGAGIYLVWPVFYTDVTDTYRLSRRGRLRTDLGGVYFNVLFVLAATGIFMMTGYAPLLVLVALVQFETLRQFLPIVRLDGFYVISDLAGVPNLFAYMKPVLVTLVGRRNRAAVAEARHKLAELNPRARKLITAWVVVTAPILVGSIGLFLFLLPRLAGIAWGSVGHQVGAMTTADGSITPVGVANSSINLILLTLPVAGMVYILVMLLKRGAKLAATWWPRRPTVTGTTVGTLSALLMLVVIMVWPTTFASALRRAQDAQGTSRPPVLGTAGIGMGDLPAAIRILPPPAPPAPPVTDQDGPTPDDDKLGDAGNDTAAPHAAPPATGSPDDTSAHPHPNSDPPDPTTTTTTTAPRQPPTTQPRGDGSPGQAPTTAPPSADTDIPDVGDQPEDDLSDDPDRDQPRPLTGLARALRDFFG